MDIIKQMNDHVDLMQKIQQAMKDEKWLYVDKFAETIQWIIGMAYELDSCQREK